MASPKRVQLRWSGEGLAFLGCAAGTGVEICLDGGANAGPSPTDALLLSLASCMAIDILTILQKSRVPVTSLDMDVEGERAEEAPKRFTRLRLSCRVAGPDISHHPRLERALQLSRDRYCSVLHTLRPDIELDLAITRS